MQEVLKLEPAWPDCTRANSPCREVVLRPFEGTPRRAEVSEVWPASLAPEARVVRHAFAALTPVSETSRCRHDDCTVTNESFELLCSLVPTVASFVQDDNGGMQ